MAARNGENVLPDVRQTQHDVPVRRHRESRATLPTESPLPAADGAASGRLGAHAETTTRTRASTPPNGGLRRPARAANAFSALHPGSLATQDEQREKQGDVSTLILGLSVETDVTSQESDGPPRGRRQQDRDRKVKQDAQIGRAVLGGASMGEHDEVAGDPRQKMTHNDRLLGFPPWAESRWVWALGFSALAIVLVLGFILVIRVGAREGPNDLPPAPKVREVVATDGSMPVAGPTGGADAREDTPT